MIKFNEIIDRLSEYEDISILFNKKTIGKVLKIHVSGDLKEEGYESGYLFLPKGTGIKKHKHTKEMEFYTLIKGTLSVNGQAVTEAVCEIGESHNIDVTTEDTVISYHKIKPKQKKESEQKNVVKAKRF